MSQTYSTYYKYRDGSIGGSGGGAMLNSPPTAGEDLKEYFAQVEGKQYEQPIQDPDTGDDVIGRIVANERGIIDINQFPEYRLVKRNWRRHKEDLQADTNLNTLFISPPVNEGNYRFLNGVDYYKTEAIQTMANIPEGVTGQAYVMVETADKFAKQVVIVPSTGKLFYRYKLEDGSLTDWLELGMPDNIPQENIINLVSELLAFNNRLFSVEETNYSQDQSIQTIQTQIGYIAAINNTQDVLIKALQDAINALSGANGDYVTKTQLNGGSLGAVLVKDSPDNQSYTFKRVHGIELVNFNIPIAKVGEYFEANIPISSFLKSEFVWRDVQVKFLAYSDTWVDYSYTDNNGITLKGTPTEEGKDTIFAMIGLNGIWTTYPLLIQSSATVSDASNLTATITQDFPPKISLAWTYTGPTATEFKVYRRENGGSLGVIGFADGAARTYEDVTANQDRNVDYQIEPIVGGTAGTRSNIASVKTLPIVDTTGGLFGRYYPNKTLTSPSLATRIDSVIDFIWTDVEPVPGFGQTSNFSVRHTGYLRWPTTGTIKFRTRSDDGLRMWVGGTQVIDQWRDYSVTYGIWEFTTALNAGENKSVIIEYYQGEGGAELHFEYQDASGVWKTVPSANLVPESTAGETMPAPVLTSATATGENSQNLVWTYTGDVENFTVQRSLTGSSTGLWVNVGSFTTAIRTGDFAGLSAGTKYYWRIRANYQGRTSDWSNVISAVTDGGVVSTDDLTTGTNIAANRVALKRAIGWNSPSFDYAKMSDSDAVISRAREAGVEFATIYIEWWELEQAENSFNFSELRWRILKQAERGLGFVLVMPHKFAYKYPTNPNPYTSWRMSGGGKQHRWNGSTWSLTDNIWAADCAYLDYTEAVQTRDGWMLDAVKGATGSAASVNYMSALERLTAKTCDYIYSNSDLANICYGVMFIDGGSSETGFPTSNIGVRFPADTTLDRIETANGIQHGDFGDASKAAFGVWLSQKYSSLAAFQQAWTLDSSITFEFASTYAYHYYPDATGPGPEGVVQYNIGTRKRDWFKFLVDQHRKKYARFINAVHNPSSVIGGLANPSPSARLDTIAYLTEILTTAQGYTWAAAAVEMLKDFDQVWSSMGSDGGPITSDSHFKAFAQRMSVLRGTIPSQKFAQELDTDRFVYSDDGRVGSAKTMAAIFPQGAIYFIATFFRTAAEWDETNYKAENGDIISFKDDMKRGYEAHVKDKYRTLPVVSRTLTYNYDNILDNVANPNGVTQEWMAQVAPTVTGLSNTYIDIKMNR